jgi:hypothetical protein
MRARCIAPSSPARPALLAPVAAAATAATAAALAGCGSVNDTPPDAPAAEPDAATCPKDLLVGGTSMTVESQGWAIVMQAPASLTYGADYVRLETTTNAGSRMNGQLLLQRQGALPPPPFGFEVELLIERVDTHNQLDAAAAILGSFTLPFGEGSDRGLMVYLDAGRIGWADDSQSTAAAITDGAYHKVRLTVAADGTARVTLDGNLVASRAGFVSNGAIAVGDQTNDPDVDAATRIRRITRLCP